MSRAEELADALEIDGWEKPSDYEVADELRRLSAVEAELDALKKAISEAEPVAHIWQHDETGREGFVSTWQVQNGWEENNKRLKVVRPLYTLKGIK